MNYFDNHPDPHVFNSIMATLTPEELRNFDLIRQNLLSLHHSLISLGDILVKSSPLPSWYDNNNARSERLRG